jgi:glycine/D-amino acid oxidase-like deaminating enzyme
VLALGAWAAAVPAVKRSLVVISSDVVATDSVPERLAELGWPLGMAISDSRRLVNYYRQTDDGRVVLGKGGGGVAFGGRIGSSFHGASQRADEVRASLRRLYPALWDVPVERSWRGPVDYSVTGLPFMFALEEHPEVILGAGFCGNGVGPSFVAGRVLGAMGVGRPGDAAPEGLRRRPPAALPPEPARKAGAILVRGAVARKERAEDLGRPVGRLNSLVASLDPTTFVDRG